MDVSFSLSLCLSLFFIFFFICMHHCPVLHYCLPTNPTSNIFKDGLIVEWNKNNLKDNKKQIGEKKELLGSKALTWYYKLCTLSSLALTSSCIKLGSFSSQTKLKKKKKKASVCMLVRVSGEKKSGHCEQTGSAMDRQGFIILSSTQSNVAPMNRE